MEPAAMAQHKDPIFDIAHLGNVELLTPKPEQSRWYFRDVLGMEVVHEEGRSIYLRGYGDYALSTVKLTEHNQPGVGCISWRCVSPQALDRRVKALEEAGCDIGWTNGDFGRGRTFRFNDPEGHVMEIYFEEEQYKPTEPELESSLKNLPQRYTGRGAGARRIDHLAVLANDVPKNRKFAQELLGFQLREQVVFNDGKDEIGSWLSPSPVHHQIAFVQDVKGGKGRLHHFAMWLDSQQDVLRAADILAENGIEIEAGPSKHNNSQGFYLYSFEPGGNRIELYSGSFLVFAPDFETVVWNEEERGTGVYWGGALPDSFLQYATPDIKAKDGQAREDVPVFDPV
jgi:catechol 2,3-dioxygenase